MLEGFFFLLMLVFSVFLVRLYRNAIHRNDLSLLEQEIETDFADEIKESIGSGLNPALEWIENEQALDRIEDLKMKPDPR